MSNCSKQPLYAQCMKHKSRPDTPHFNLRDLEEGFCVTTAPCRERRTSSARQIWLLTLSTIITEQEETDADRDKVRVHRPV